jgi:predicted NodU family carbamoyl transferase
MNIVSLSCNGHDSSATFLINGKHHKTVIEERLTSIKHDQVLFSVFEHIKCFNEEYGIDKIISTNGTEQEFEYISDILSKYKLENKYLDLEFEFEEHHLYHAASGFYSSGFDRAVCLVMDGWGADLRLLDLLEILQIDLSKDDYDKVSQLTGWKFLETTSIYGASYPDNFEILFKNFLRPHPPPEQYLQKSKFPYKWLKKIEDSSILSCNSNYDVGMLYGLISGHLFTDNEQCGKVMGLSGYGKPNKDLPEFIIKNGFVDMNFAFSDMCINTINFPSMEHNGDFQKRADIAYKVQKHTEDIFRMRIKDIIRIIPDVKNIVLSGGVALNICANSVIQEEFPDINFYIDPIASDGCQSYGAAKYYHYKETGSMIKEPMHTIYHGIHQPHPSILKKQIELDVAKHNK